MTQSTDWKKDKCAHLKTGQKREAKDLQSSQPNLRPLESYRIYIAGSQFQACQSQEGDLEQQAWICKGQTMPNKHNGLLW